MDVLSYLKFWRPSTSTTIKIAKFLDCGETDNILDEEDDSFFELEFTTSYFNTNSYSYNSDVDNDKEDDDNDDDNNIYIDNGVVKGKNTKSAEAASKPSSYSAKVSPTLGDLFSRRRVIPLDTNSSPQSPVSSPKMITPRFRVFMFKKSSNSKPGPKQEETDSCFTMKHNVKQVQVQVQPKLADNQNNKNPLETTTLLSESKRFSKEALQKYLKLVKPSNVKVSCKEGEGDQRVSARTTPPNIAASPASRRTVKPQQQLSKRDPLVGIRLAGKRLGKTKLDGSLKAASSPARRDDSLAQQHDGIEGAILHCKRSYNYGRDMSMLSRSSSSPLYEKFRV